MIAAMSYPTSLLYLPSLNPRLPGLRRNTAALAAMYGAYALLGQWSFIAAQRRSRIFVRAACLALLAHHVMVYPGNVASVDAPSRDRNTGFFAVRESPEASLTEWVKRTASGETLPCVERYPDSECCRHGEVFAAVAGYRRGTICRRFRSERAMPAVASRLFCRLTSGGVASFLNEVDLHRCAASSCSTCSAETRPLPGAAMMSSGSVTISRSS